MDQSTPDKNAFFNVICVKDDAFYALVEDVVLRIMERHQVKEDKWISEEEAMALMRIRSKTTLQKFRDSNCPSESL